MQPQKYSVLHNPGNSLMNLQEGITYNTVKGTRIPQLNQWQDDITNKKENYQIASEGEDSEVEHGALAIDIWCWFFH